MARDVDLSDWVLVLPKAYENHLCEEHGGELYQNGTGWVCEDCEAGTDRKPVTYEIQPLTGQEFRYANLSNSRKEQRRGAGGKKGRHARETALLIRMEAELFVQCIRNVENYAVTVRNKDTGGKERVVIVDGETFARAAESEFLAEARVLINDASKLDPTLGERRPGGEAPHRGQVTIEIRGGARSGERAGEPEA